MAEEKKEGAGLSKLRITKKAYVFDLRKKYAVSRNFLLKKEAETPAEDIKQQLQAFFKKKSSQAKEGEKNRAALAAAADSKEAKPASSPLTVIATVMIVILLAVLGGAAFVIWKLGAADAGQQPVLHQQAFSGSFDYSIKQMEMISAPEGDPPARIAYYLIDYSADSLSSLKFRSRFYSQKPSTQVFLLDYAREGADAYPVFRRQLLDSLRSKGIAIGEITVDKLSSLPGGATLVVPTGYFPKELLGMDSNFDFIDLLSRGNNIIYIGFPIDRALDKQGLTLPAVPKGLQFAKAKPVSTESFRLFDAQYTASGNGELSSAGMLYGSVSVIKSGSGTLLILPQSLDGGWRGDERISGGQAAALDVSRLIEEQRWLTPLAVSEATPTIGAQKSGTLELMSQPFSADHAFVEFTTEAKDRAGLGGRTVDFFEIEKKQKGEMQPRELRSVPYFLSGQLTRLNILLKEDNSKPVKLFIRLYKNGVLSQEEELEFGLTNPTSEKPKDIQLNVDPGTYIVRVENREGKVYAETTMDAIGLDVETNSTNWQTKHFSFYLSAAGQTVNPRSVGISLDEKNARTYTSSQYQFVGGKTALEYDYPGDLKPGNHTFYFTVGNWKTAVDAEYRQQKYPWDNPLVVVLGLLSVLVFGVGMVLRRPETLQYGLDVPDFPPMSTLKIPVKRESVLQIFNDVNASYSWQYMPLRAEEIKSGFRRLTYNGKPILVGDFNLERLLSRLKDEGKAKEELGYYGLAEWEPQSRHSVRYLTIYRIMRNVFVNNAVKFSKLDSMSECDVKAIVGKDEVYLHIMEEPFEAQDRTEGGGAYRRGAEAVVHRALATAKSGTSVIVFRTDEERDAFRESLSTPSKLAVALKMEINNGNVLLLPVKNAISAFLKGVVK